MIRPGPCRSILTLTLLGLVLTTPAATPSVDAQVAELGMTSLNGRPAPAFSLKTLNGTEMALASLRGRVVMLYFWATW